MIVKCKKCGKKVGVVSGKMLEIVRGKEKVWISGTDYSILANCLGTEEKGCNNRMSMHIEDGKFTIDDEDVETKEEEEKIKQEKEEQEKKEIEEKKQKEEDNKKKVEDEKNKQDNNSPTKDIEGTKTDDKDNNNQGINIDKNDANKGNEGEEGKSKFLNT
jgi:hypothetical protein